MHGSSILGAAVIDFRALFEASPNPYLVLAPDAPRFTIIGVNDAYLRATGTTRSDILGRGLFDALPDRADEAEAASIRKLQESLERVLATRAPDRMPVQQYNVLPRENPNGAFEERHWQPSNTPVIGADGELTAIIHHVEDVTVEVLAQRAEKATAEALRESEARYRNMADHAPVMMWLTDPSGYCTHLNRRWYEFTGQPESEALGLGWLDVVHPDDRAKAEDAFLSSNVASAPFRVEYRLRRADGTYRWVIDAAAPRFDASGRFLGYVGSVIDIDERREAEEHLRRSEEELRASESKLRQIADNLPALIGYVDAEQRYRFNNKAYETWLGRSPESLYGLHLRDAVGPATYDRIRPHVEAALSGQRTGHEWWAFLPSGTRYVKSDYIPDIQADGSVAGFFVLASDLSEYKQSETALAESEARLSMVLESVSDGFYALDAEGRFIVFNAAAERFFRRDRQSVLGRKVWDVFPEAKDAFEPVYNRIMGGGPAETFEAPSKVRPGHILEIRAARQPGGGLTVSLSDVTARKHAEQMVQDRTARLEILAEAIEKAPSARSLSELLAVTERAARRLTRADGVVVVLRSGEQHFHPPHGVDPPAGPKFPMLDAVSGWSLRHRQTAIVRDVWDDGRVPQDVRQPAFVRSLVLVPLISAGQASAFVGAYWSTPHDSAPEEVAVLEALARTCGAVLQRLEVEEALRTLNQSLEAQVAERTAERDRIWQNSNELMAVFGFDGTRRAVNPAWSRVLGYDEETLLNSPFGGLTHPDDREKLAQMVQKLARGEHIIAFEHRARHADGSYRHISWTAVPGDGVFYAIGRDVTEHRHAEEALRQAQKMEAVGQLTGGVAHDFNNMLTIIRSSTDLLRRPDLPEDRRRKYVDAISETVDRASKLTNQLLAFARRQALKPEVFDVAARTRAISDMLRTIVGSRIRVVTEINGEACFAEADVSQFETALVNMAVNARDAMDGEGTLTIKVGEVSRVASIRGQRGGRGPFAAVSLTDTGSGIAPDQLGLIFEPFFTTKEVGKGTGLGLSQVYGFAKQSGGDVDVQSTLGEGTTFTLYLPRVEGPADTNNTSDDAHSNERLESGRGRRVLVVEDNVDVGRFSTQILKDLGYETTWAANAAEALARLEENDGQFDVVFSDVVMPGISGVELGEEIRRRYPGLPVILTSGYSHVLAEEGRHGFELLQKPYAAEELSRVLRRLARR